MKAEIIDGVLTVKPETPTEEWALRTWAEKSTIRFPRDVPMDLIQKYDPAWSHSCLALVNSKGDEVIA